VSSVMTYKVISPPSVLMLLLDLVLAARTSAMPNALLSEVEINVLFAATKKLFNSLLSLYSGLAASLYIPHILTDAQFKRSFYCGHHLGSIMKIKANVQANSKTLLRSLRFVSCNTDCQCHQYNLLCPSCADNMKLQQMWVLKSFTFAKQISNKLYKISRENVFYNNLDKEDADIESNTFYVMEYYSVLLTSDMSTKNIGGVAIDTNPQASQNSDSKKKRDIVIVSLVRIFGTFVISHGQFKLELNSFKNFAKEWDFSHETSSPYYPQSNGKVEHAVQTANSLMRKGKHAQTDPFLAILDFRNTPTLGFETSPAQRLMNRRTKTLIPTKESLLKPKIEGRNVQKEIQYSKERQAHYYNQGAKELSSLKEGDVVRVEPANKYQKTWEKGTVNQKVNERSYEINIKGKTFRRIRSQLLVLKTNENNKTGEDSNEFKDDEQFDHEEQQENCNNNTIPHQSPQQNTLDNNTTLRTRSGRRIKSQ
ncbi:Hypothetical predicted protein, partial [Mytilus galloprovincialis]